MKVILILTVLGLCGATALALSLRPASRSASDVREMQTAAVAFLGSLNAEQRAQATFPMDDAERKAWSNVPYTLFERKGISFGEMSNEQRLLAQKLLSSALSSQGYLKATGIMRLDEVLVEFARARSNDKERKLPFGHDYYWIGIFGDAAAGEVWGWQLDGHHLAINFTIVGDEVSVTPTFMGSDPAEVRDGMYAGWRILGEEDDKGRLMFDSLSEAQREKALLSVEGPRDVFTGPGRGDRIKTIEGLSAADMNAEQLGLLMSLLAEFAGNLEHGLAATHLARIQAAGIDKVHFAWSGTEPGKPYYYRLHGPTVLIEFDNSYPPGRRAGAINHVHTIWRDPTNDYGEDLLLRHRAESHQDGK